MSRPPLPRRTPRGLRRLGVLALALTAPLAGCGDDEGAADPVLGIWAVSAHTLSEMGCDASNPLVDPASCFGCAVETPFFEVTRRSFFGQSALTLVDCASPTACGDADDPVELGGPVFARKEGGEWVGHAYTAAYGGANCTYIETEWRLAKTDEGVRLTRTVLRNAPETPSGMLTDDACLALSEDPPPSDELTCDTLETVVGVPPTE